MGNSAFQNPTPPPAEGEGPGPFAFDEFLTVPANPQSPGGDAGYSAPPLKDQAVVPAHDPDVAAELRLLRQIRDVGMGTAANLAVTENAPPNVTEIPHPVPGVHRWLLPRVPVGGQFAVTEALADVLVAEPARLGGRIVNSGAKPIVLALSLTRNLTPVTARIFLAAEGGSWDLRLSEVVWIGSVSAESRGGAGQLEIAVL